jgi:3-deoxy-7-phosphoheptulonate synthase
MNEHPSNVLVVALRDPRDPAAPSRLLGMLALGAEGARRWRCFDDRLLVAWPDVGTASSRGLERSVELLDADPAVDRVVLLRAGARLGSEWPVAPEAGPPTRPFDRRSAATPLLIAGPCTVESEAHLLETAALVAEAGAHGLRAGIYKPRTCPYTFAGLGDAALESLSRARTATGLPVVTEVLESAKIAPTALHADVLQIGSRNMFNAPLLFRAGANVAGRPILLKRGFGATAEELLWAAEYVLLGRFAAGRREPGVWLCERGVRSVESAGRFTFEPTVLPWLRARTHLPILVDPSHAAGERTRVMPLARAALAAGADGLLVEVHPSPAAAWCDGRHALDGPQIRALAEEMRAMGRPCAGETE